MSDENFLFVLILNRSFGISSFRHFAFQSLLIFLFGIFYFGDFSYQPLTFYLLDIKTLDILPQIFTTSKNLLPLLLKLLMIVL